MTDHGPLYAAGPFERYRAELALGTHWYLAALRAAGVWTLRSEIVRQRRLVYLIDGQALDLLLVIERLVTAGGGARRDELHRLLFHRRAADPAHRRPSFATLWVRRAIRRTSRTSTASPSRRRCIARLSSRRPRPMRWTPPRAGEIHERIYGRSQAELLAAYAEERGENPPRRLAWPAYQSFIYWLFRLRVRTSVAPRIASDTRKALDFLRRQRGAEGGSPDPLRPNADASPENIPAPANVVDLDRPV